MKIFILTVLSVGTVLCVPEAPAAPYAPSGWRPNGPAFELPSKNTDIADAEDTYRTPKEEQTVVVTEEEIEYTGELGTTESIATPFAEYGPPEGNNDEEPTTPAADESLTLTVQGLPSSEPAQFRAPLKDGRNQKLRVQQRQKTARLQAPKQFQRQQISSFSSFQAPNQFGVGVAQTGQRNGNTFGQSVSQFAQLQLPRNNRVRPVPVFQPVFFQRQEVAADPIAVPAQAYGPAKEYGPPLQAFAPPTDEPQEFGDIDQPEQPQAEEPENPQDEEVTTEGADAAEDGDGEDVVAISNSFSNGRYTQSRQGKAAKLRTGAKLRVANLRQFEPIYTFNQFGQLVRIN